MSELLQSLYPRLPTTKAGRRLVEEWFNGAVLNTQEGTVPERVIAIETEARAEVGREVKHALDALNAAMDDNRLMNDPNLLEAHATLEGSTVTDQNLAATVEEFEPTPTPEDQAVWEAVYGFTPQEIGVMARYVEMPEDKVTRLIELARFIRTLPKQEVRS